MQLTSPDDRKSQRSNKQNEPTANNSVLVGRRRERRGSICCVKVDNLDHWLSINGPGAPSEDIIVSSSQVLFFLSVFSIRLFQDSSMRTHDRQCATNMPVSKPERSEWGWGIMYVYAGDRREAEVSSRTQGAWQRRQATLLVAERGGAGTTALCVVSVYVRN